MASCIVDVPVEGHMVSNARQSKEIRIYSFCADTRVTLLINSWFESHRAEPNRYGTKAALLWFHLFYVLDSNFCAVLTLCTFSFFI